MKSKPSRLRLVLMALGVLLGAAFALMVLGFSAIGVVAVLDQHDGGTRLAALRAKFETIRASLQNETATKGADGPPSVAAASPTPSPITPGSRKIKDIPLAEKRAMSLNAQWLGGGGDFFIEDVPEMAEGCRQACGEHFIAGGVRAMPDGDTWQCLCAPGGWSKAETERKRKELHEFHEKLSQRRETAKAKAQAKANVQGPEEGAPSP
ncbi:MAG TPA: hypothetical protein VKM54_03540 [Myxococcota bacterium]|nr:hypothetical protein [Myxococcota bacterium]